MTNEQNMDIFICESCNFTCNRPAEYVRHLNTNKHSRLISPIEKTYSCLCGKIYKHQPSLCKHKKSCINLVSDSESILDIVKEIAKEQKEFILKYQVQVPRPLPLVHPLVHPLTHPLTHPLVHPLETRVIKHVREKKVIGFTCPKKWDIML